MKKLEELTRRGQVGRLRRLAAAALPSWGLEGARLESLGHGENTTFAVHTKDGRRLMIRVARPGYRTDVELASEVAWLEYLSEHWDGADVPRPVRTLDGAAFALASAPGVPQARRCVLFEWVDGAIRWKSASANHLRALGRAQASLHASLSGFEPGPDFHRRAYDTCFGEEPGWWRSEGYGDELVSLCDVAYERAEDSFQRLCATPGAVGLIHIDMHLWNVTFQPGGRVGIIDFDDTMVAPLVIDVLVVIESLRDHERADALIDAFMEGYDAHTPIPDDWEEHLRAQRAQFHVNGLAWLRSRQDIPRLRERYARFVEEVEGMLREQLA